MRPRLSALPAFGFRRVAREAHMTSEAHINRYVVARLADGLRDDPRENGFRILARGDRAAPLKCIFFLTFERTDSIYESRCDFF